VKETSKVRIKKGSRTIFRNVELAKSYTGRMKGLSGRREIGSGGLLMEFPCEGRHGIWMPGMNFPIDIIFISAGKRVVDIRHDARPMSMNPKSWKIFKPGKKAKYVLELPANAAKGKLCIGDMLAFSTG
jgi:uncharacterized membrane protein (UPF0127 family)